MREPITGFISIDGVDLTPYIQEGGFSWQRYDLDSGETQRLMDGNLARHRITTKHNLRVACKPLSTEDASKVLNAIKPKSFQVRYLDPAEGNYVVRTCYASDIPAQVLIFDKDGIPCWQGIEFNIIEY